MMDVLLTVNLYNLSGSPFDSPYPQYQVPLSVKVLVLLNSHKPKVGLLSFSTGYIKPSAPII